MESPNGFQFSSSWRLNQDVLSTKSFPSTSTLRCGGKHHTCSCDSTQSHKGLFEFLKEVVTPAYKAGIEFTPAVKVCWNAENLWECKLPRALSGLDKRLEFYELPSIWHAQKVLMEGTYWFPRIMGKKTGTVNSVMGKAVLRLLAGKKSFSGQEEVWQLVKLKLSKEGVNRLRNILATVDGLIMQVTLCFFETDFLSWERIDQMTHSLICQLLPDYFRDQESSQISTFEKIKRLRKAVKEAGFNPVGDTSLIDVPRELSFYRPIVNMIGSNKSPMAMDRVMTLSQTRASGVPPRSVYLKTLQKIRDVLTTPPDPSNFKAMEFYICRAIDQIYFDVMASKSQKEREIFLSRCLDKAKISLSDSGEFFTKTREGGKLEACRKVLFSHKEKGIAEINLHTGLKTGKILREENSNVGDMIFNWACGLFTDRSHIYETNVMSVRISLVAELGKWRGITVSHLGHSVLLHVASHVLLEFLKELPEARSGISAANHAWNFFKQLSHKNPMANFLFDQEVFVFSTDWETSTDYCDHTIAQAIVNRLMFNLGFPRWYRQTVCFALCAPRQVEFLDDEDKTLSKFYTLRGVLMGDPVTKVILHCYHHIARFAAEFTLRK